MEYNYYRSQIIVNSKDEEEEDGRSMSFLFFTYDIVDWGPRQGKKRRIFMCSGNLWVKFMVVRALFHVENIFNYNIYIHIVKGNH